MAGQGIRAATALNMERSPGLMKLAKHTAARRKIRLVHVGSRSVAKNGRRRVPIPPPVKNAAVRFEAKINRRGTAWYLKAWRTCSDWAR